MDLPVELIKQAPTIAALLWLTWQFLKYLREERAACSSERIEALKQAESARRESHTEFLAELKRTHEMYRKEVK
jgi:choline-glycine betaine transporter